LVGGKAKEEGANPVPSPEKDDEAEVIKKQIIREMASNAGKKSGAVRRAKSKKAQPDEQPA